MQYIIKPPQQVKTLINLPASKSISNRALIIHALLAKNKGALPCNSSLLENLHNLSDCDDTNVIIHALREMPPIIDIGAAGTAMRFMTAYLSLTSGEYLLTGSERMKNRPIKVLVDALRALGANIEYKEKKGYPPLLIKGQQLTGGQLDIPGNVSSQYISALLMIGPYMEKGLALHLTGEIVSRPYIDLALHIMHEYGVKVEWSDVDTIIVAPQEYLEREYVIENDWSAAGYWYEIMALQHDSDSFVKLPGLTDGSRQGDSAVRYLFSLLGIKTEFETKEEETQTTIKLTKHNRMLNRLDFDFVNQPDLAQTLIALCPLLDIKFHFTGLESLRIKETDRINAMMTEMKKLGYVLINPTNAELSWEGDRCAPAADVAIDTYEDHRMAMSFAPLALVLGEIKINHPEVVSKSYPRFWDDLKKAGFSVEIVN